ncbi:amidohydrolase family protein [Flavivirga jejuensis]|uniref:Amidohydrolase family protein n=1 Tax=Flavivirga jejuensis TaxID=870487 RepID=A0ABT8WVJ3_9FLAO|nr:amidohydrolase family protein [Flavivirga jejuensis]MDO5977206.1 amidohydrolase family protein [Flavivirga jejuensis]
MKIFDSHFHIINPKYPLFKNNGYLPPDFTIKDYQEKTKEIEIIGGAIVSGSFQKFHQEYLIDALSKLGNNYFGVANIPLKMEEKDLDRLNRSNIVAVRFNLKRGGSEGIDNLIKLSNLLFDKYNWHTELYVDSKDLKELKPILMEIPQFSIDHLGLSKSGIKELYYWAERGVKIKATGFGRIDFDPIPIMKKIYSINPRSLMFGTDLPSTRAQIPFTMKDVELIKNNFTEPEQQNLFYKNSLEWYIKN